MTKLTLSDPEYFKAKHRIGPGIDPDTVSRHILTVFYPESLRTTQIVVENYSVAAPGDETTLPQLHKDCTSSKNYIFIIQNDRTPQN